MVYMNEEEETRFIVRFSGTSQKLTEADLERKMTIIVAKLGLEDIQLEVGLERKLGMSTPASLAAVWGYIENYMADRKTIDPLTLAETIGMSESTAKKHCQTLVQPRYGVLTPIRKVRRPTVFIKNSTPAVTLAEYLKQFPVHIGRWEPKLKTW